MSLNIRIFCCKMMSEVQGYVQKDLPLQTNEVTIDIIYQIVRDAYQVAPVL